MNAADTFRDRNNRILSLDGRRFNGKCRCGARNSGVVAASTFHHDTTDAAGRPAVRVFFADGSTGCEDFAGRTWGACKACRGPVALRAVVGKHRADKACDARCENATGHDCECSCGGKNHGKHHG